MVPRGSLMGGLLVLSTSSVVFLVNAKNADCLPDPYYQWGYNSKGESPCDVAGSLSSVCAGETVTIVALDPGGMYTGSQASGYGNTCHCSSVYYAILSACSQCQGGIWQTWKNQTINCDTISIQTLPIAIHAGTIVPPWAYYDYPAIGTFNITLARPGLFNSTTGPTSSSGPATPSASNGTGNTGATGKVSRPWVGRKKTNPFDEDRIYPEVLAPLVAVPCVLVFIGIVYFVVMRRKSLNTAATGSTGTDANTENPPTYTQAGMDPVARNQTSNTEFEMTLTQSRQDGKQ